MLSLNSDQREIQRKLRVLEHADKIGDVSKAYRYFGIGRASFYRSRKAYSENGEFGLTYGKLEIALPEDRHTPFATSRKSARSLRWRARPVRSSGPKLRQTSTFRRFAMIGLNREYDHQAQ